MDFIERMADMEKTICDGCVHERVKWDKEPCCVCKYSETTALGCCYTAVNVEELSELEKAKKVVFDAGYVIVKVTEGMDKRMEDCASGINEDCCGCCASVCLLNDAS
jgi:hypothetical protein